MDVSVLKETAHAMCHWPDMELSQKWLLGVTRKTFDDLQNCTCSSSLVSKITSLEKEEIGHNKEVEKILESHPIHLGLYLYRKFRYSFMSISNLSSEYKNESIFLQTMKPASEPPVSHVMDGFVFRIEDEENIPVKKISIKDNSKLLMEILSASVTLCPYNWSAWVDIISILVTHILPIDFFKLPIEHRHLKEKENQMTSSEDLYSFLTGNFNLPNLNITRVALFELSLAIGRNDFARDLYQEIFRLFTFDNSYLESRRNYMDSSLLARSISDDTIGNLYASFVTQMPSTRCHFGDVWSSFYHQQQALRSGDTTLRIKSILKALSSDWRNERLWFWLLKEFEKFGTTESLRLAVAACNQMLSCSVPDSENLRQSCRLLLSCYEHEMRQENKSEFCDRLLESAYDTYLTILSKDPTMEDVSNLVNCCKLANRCQEIADLWYRFGLPKVTLCLESDSSLLLQELQLCQVLKESGSSFRKLVDAVFINWKIWD
eukprot:GHVP01024191.1.p1 GENE.GHVP01024191.1~~GHVP01024191.1.p1  ORF type:complete len:505 (+),score=77.74 GHVP01024191.1:48-1517(+)